MHKIASADWLAPFFDIIGAVSGCIIFRGVVFPIPGETPQKCPTNHNAKRLLPYLLNHSIVYLSGCNNLDPLLALLADLGEQSFGEVLPLLRGVFAMDFINRKNDPSFLIADFKEIFPAGLPLDFP